MHLHLLECLVTYAVPFQINKCKNGHANGETALLTYSGLKRLTVNQSF